MKAAANGVQTVVLPGADHWLAEEAPARCWGSRRRPWPLPLQGAGGLPGADSRRVTPTVRTRGAPAERSAAPSVFWTAARIRPGNQHAHTLQLQLWFLRPGVIGTHNCIHAVTAQQADDQFRLEAADDVRHGHGYAVHHPPPLLRTRPSRSPAAVRSANAVSAASTCSGASSASQWPMLGTTRLCTSSAASLIAFPIASPRLPVPPIGPYGAIPNGPIEFRSRRRDSAIAQAFGSVNTSAPPSRSFQRGTISSAVRAATASR